jgi:quercetin dioxygenase-like cupin family protein
MEQITWTLQEADPDHFTGGARSALMASSHDRAAVRLYYVKFEPGARTHWHMHTGTQILLVHQGRCLLQREGGVVEELREGETTTIPPLVRHWHGAGREEGMAHLAINLDNRETRWLGAVDDGEYPPPG